jgi:transcription antitermination factor NusG
MCTSQVVCNADEAKEGRFSMLTSLSIDERNRLDTAWWAVYTRHQHEKVVAEMLSAKGFDVFLPLYQSARRWKDRSKVLSLPLFPCYLFVRGGIDRRLQVVTTPGVHMILFRGERVAIVPDAEIEALQRAVEGSLRVEPHPFLKCGMRVRVTRGALAGVEGILIRKKNLFRLILSVDMLAQSVAVEVHSSDVEPCGSRSQEWELRSSSVCAAPSQFLNASTPRSTAS